MISPLMRKKANKSGEKNSTRKFNLCGVDGGADLFTTFRVRLICQNSRKESTGTAKKMNEGFSEGREKFLEIKLHLIQEIAVGTTHYQGEFGQYCWNNPLIDRVLQTRKQLI
jgi:hypothetical protein